MSKSIAPESPLTDIHGNPFYIGLLPSIDSEAEITEAAWVQVTINGHPELLSAHDAMESGLAIVRTCAQVASLPLLGGVHPGLKIAFGDSPVVEVDPETASEIGVNLLGSTYMAIHDHAAYLHMVEHLKLTREEIIEFYRTMKPIITAEYLNPPLTPATD